MLDYSPWSMCLDKLFQPAGASQHYAERMQLFQPKLGCVADHWHTASRLVD